MQDASSSTDTQLRPEDQRVVEEEECLFELVVASIREAAHRPGRDLSQIYRQFHDVREGFEEADEDELPAIATDLHVLKSIATGTRKAADLPNSRSPYFAHMRLETQGKTRDVLLGHVSFVDPKGRFSIIDWRHAPVARIFFMYQENEEYEEEVDKRMLSGKIISRRVVGIERGRLYSVLTGDYELRRPEDGGWVKRKRDSVLLDVRDEDVKGLAVSVTESADHRTPDVTALLDQDQYDLLNAPEEEPLLILGAAGCGKTTVALHRMAALNFRDPEHFRQDKMLVIVPEKGLARLSERILKMIGMNKATVATFDDWAVKESRRLFKDSPPRIAGSAPDQLLPMKRHPAMAYALDELIRRQRQDLLIRLKKRLPPLTDFDSFFEERKDEPLAKQLRDLQRFMMTNLKSKSAKVSGKHIQQVFVDEWTLFFDLVSDIRGLFANREVLEHAMRASDGEITEDMIKWAIRRSIDQSAEPTEKEYEGMDEDRLATMDGRTIDDGTPMGLGGTIDQEDLTLIYDLLYRKAGEIRTPSAALKLYSHLVVDEAQELSPIELSVLGRCRAERSSITIAGDQAQQLDPSACFSTWEKLLDAIGVERTRTAHLKTNYRCPKPIALFAHAILGPIAPKDQPHAVRDGVPVRRTIFESEGQQAMIMPDTLAATCANDPRANIAVIARSPEGAAHFFDLLKHVPGCRLIEDGEFTFAPGIEVTHVAQVKGLEFDYVLIPDADPYRYPDTHEARRHMHVAATRPIHQLWVCSLKEESPIIREIGPEKTTTDA